jgi:hypothetical protein
VLVPKLDAPKNSHLILPSFILLLSSVLTIIFAILSTKPNVTKTTFSSQDIINRKVNLLFFGNFQQMQFDDYHNAMKDLIKDRDYIYDSMVKDLYYLGKFLTGSISFYPLPIRSLWPELLFPCCLLDLLF